MLRPMLLAVAMTGCAASASYLYTPTPATHWASGYPSAVVAIPPDAHQGTVDLSSFGITELQPEGGGAIPMLHVRMIVENDGDATPWTLDAGDQVLEIPGEAQRRPVFVNSDVQLPLVTIGLRERRVLDFYYALPASIGDEEELGGFRVRWSVTTPSQTVSSHTSFQRIERRGLAPSPQVLVVAGWGPWWWYRPGHVYGHVRVVR